MGQSIEIAWRQDGPFVIPVDDASELTVLDQSPLQYYRLDETSGATAAVDSIGGLETMHVGGPPTGRSRCVWPWTELGAGA